MRKTILFTIPIYRISPHELRKRYDAKVKQINQDFGNDERIINLITFPQRIWEYNHIIGYIEISAKFNDVYFNVYLPNKNDFKKYYWLSKKKPLMYLQIPDYPHFRVFDDESNSEILEKILKRLNQVLELIPNNYYIDRSVFDCMTKYTDFKTLLSDVRNTNI